MNNAFLDAIVIPLNYIFLFYKFFICFFFGSCAWWGGNFDFTFL